MSGDPGTPPGADARSARADPPPSSSSKGSDAPRLAPDPSTPASSSYAGLRLAGWAGGVGGWTGEDRPSASRSAPPAAAAAGGGASVYAGLARDRHPPPRSADAPDRKRARLDPPASTTQTPPPARRDPATRRPCLFWRQGQCKNGDRCGYVHGDSLVPCENFASPRGCRFGDKCAFRHADGGRFSRARQHAAPATIVNPFAVHAENCGCETCHPGPAEDGEVVDGGAGEEGEEGEASEKASEEKPNSFVAYAGERRKTAEEAAERDAVLAMCSNVDASEALRGAWAPFAEAAMRAASAGDGDKYGGWGRR